MSFFESIFLLAGMVFVAFLYQSRLEEGNRREAERWLRMWACKGLGVPVLLWLISNVGTTPILPPLLTPLGLGRAGGNWLFRTLAIIAPGLEVIGSYWLAVTIGWFLVLLVGRMEQRRHLALAGLIWCVFVFPACWFMIGDQGWEMAGFAALLGLLPTLHYGTMLAFQKEEAPAVPIYARAIAKIKFGKYTEAEAEVIHELENHADDFEGWMMLADLYANQFNDFDEAQRTVLELCDQPNITGPQISVALNRLADWQLKLREDPDSARRVLEAICRRLPGTHLAHMAQLRISHLPATAAELRAQRNVRTIRLPALNDNIGTAAPPELTAADRREAAAQANQCVEQLRRDPNDVDSREKLARILVEQLGQAEAAIEQIQLLMDMPEQPERKLAEWLALIAAWQITYRQDPEAARKALESLTEKYPESPQAFAARWRLSLMDGERLAQKKKATAGGFKTAVDAPGEAG